MDVEQVLKKAIHALNYKNVEGVATPVYEGSLLHDRLAFVTGGSSGIGFAIARRFLAQGCCVVICSSDGCKLDSALSDLRSERAASLRLDMRDVDVFDGALDEAASLFPEKKGVDIVVNSAGVHGAGSFADVDEASWDHVMDVNLKAMFFMCQAAARHMKKKEINGNILNIGSASALKPGWTPYEISKRGVEALTLGAADVLIKDGIVVNCIAPGPVATPMMGMTEDSNLHSPVNPSGRFATADEIAGLAVVMAGPLGRLAVGSSLYATGGSGTLSNE
ncbi:MAG TPA: SDR family oxidoreductase [Candidatus Rubneribacter avistercoris]|nr:SDR family oxidoreductase [Candidatus Rubneribacter avistercoris]